MHSGPQQSRIAVRRRPVFPSIVVGGALLMMAGGAILTFGLDNVGGIGFLFLGAFQIVLGALEFVKPYLAYDPSNNELRMLDLFGVKDRVYGGPVGERVYFNGRDVVRALPNGDQIAVKAWPGRKADMARVIAALPQQPT
jgi:hypothetical protein